MNRRELLRGATAMGVGATGLGLSSGASARVDGPAPAAYRRLLRSMDGSGTDGDPYVVTDVRELQAMAEEPAASYALGNDVDASETAGWNGGAGFEPIETFSGTLDGRGYAVRGLVIDRDADVVGLYGELEWATVRDLSLVEVDVSGGDYVGALAGIGNAVTLASVAVTGRIEGAEAVGGLAGGVDAKTGEPAGSTVENCESRCEVRGDDSVGGLLGSARGSQAAPTTVTGCSASGSVVGNHHVGGLVGGADSVFDGARGVVLAQCRAAGTVATGDDPGAEFGGLVGVLDDATAEASRTEVALDCGGASNVGGIAGEVRDPEAAVLACQATGPVEGGDITGGVGGQVVYGTVRESAATGDVSGGQVVGGVAGELREGQIADTYALGDVSGETEVGGAVGSMENEFGRSTDLVRTLAGGDVSYSAGDGYVGGVLGRQEDGTDVAACYWDAETTGQRDGVGTGQGTLPAANGATTADLQGDRAASTLSAFDFEAVWRTRQDDYPTLRGLGAGGAGACPIRSDSLAIDPYPVSTGDAPSVSIVVEGADAVRVRGTDAAGGETVEFERSLVAAAEQRGATRWETTDPLPAVDDVGTWVGLTVEAEVDGDTCTVASLDNGLLDESSEMGYYVFDHVTSAVVVPGRFPDETPETTTDPDRLAEWLQARELDTNRYYGSGRGSMGAVGFDLSLAMDGDDFYEIASPRADYEDVFPVREDGVIFLDELRDAAADVDFDAYDFWVGVHAGEKVGGPKAAPASTSKGSGVYFARLLDDPWEDAAWAHEFGHVYGWAHTYDRGNDTDLCVMASTDREDVPVPYTAPYSVPMRVADTLGLTTDWPAMRSEHRQDWLAPTAWPSDDDGELGTAALPALQQYDYGEDIPILSFDGPVAETVHFLVESRPFLRQRPGVDGLAPEWDPAYGAAVVYRREAPVAGTGHLSVVESHGAERAWGILEEPGDSVRDKVGLVDPAFVTLELVDVEEGETDRSAFQTRVAADRGAPSEATRTVAVRGRVALPESLDLPAVALEPRFTPPTVDLIAEDDQGRRVGPTADGEYVVEIPGATASGRRVHGTEWISVPADASVDFRVSAAAVDQHLADLEAAGFLAPADAADPDRPTTDAVREDVEITYDASETRYEAGASVSTGDGEPWVGGTRIAVDRRPLAVGGEDDPAPRTATGGLAVVGITNDGDVAEEAVTFANRGADTLDLGGWQVTPGADGPYTVPSGTSLAAGEELTLFSRAGSDERGRLYRGADAPVLSEGGGEVVVTDADGETRLSVAYDGRGVVYYDRALRPAEAGFLGNLPVGLVGLVGAGAVVAGLGYLAVRMLAED